MCAEFASHPLRHPFAPAARLSQAALKMQAPIARSVLQALAGPASKKAQASAQAWAPVLVSSFATETSTTKSSTPTDYSLVMKKVGEHAEVCTDDLMHRVRPPAFAQLLFSVQAAEISSGITKPVEKEVGLCSGAPMDTYARQVSRPKTCTW